MAQKEFYYISSGKGNAMRILRRAIRLTKGCFNDTYVCNLAKDHGEAIEKARLVIGDEADLVVDYFESNNWRDEITTWMHHNIDKIELGVMPFGRYENEEIESVSESYIRWWIKQEVQNPIGQMIVQKFTDLANEKGLFDKWEAEDKVKRENFSKLNYICEVGQRMEFLLYCKNANDIGVCFVNTFNDLYGNIFVYTGPSAWEEGKYYKVKATIKAHEERNGEKVNRINRPKIIQVGKNVEDVK